MKHKTILVAALATLLGACAQPSIKSTVVAESLPAGQTSPQDPIVRAQQLLGEHKSSDANRVLTEFVAEAPKDWRAIHPMRNSVAIAYWDLSEMTECSRKDAAYFNVENVAWVRPSVSQAWYLLAFIALEDRDPARANADIDRALALEPDQATLLNEKATILQSAGKHEEAIGYNLKVTQLGRCATLAARSRAWRSQGISLIELGRLDEAEAALDESLRIDPGNSRTIGELKYLERMRGKNPKKAPLGIGRDQ